MNALAIINKYYSEENELKHILLTHSRSVADKALQIAVIYLLDPYTVCIYIVAIWCGAVYIQSTVRSQAVI